MYQLFFPRPVTSCYQLVQHVGRPTYVHETRGESNNIQRFADKCRSSLSQNVTKPFLPAHVWICQMSCNNKKLNQWRLTHLCILCMQFRWLIFSHAICIVMIKMLLLSKCCTKIKWTSAVSIVQHWLALYCVPNQRVPPKRTFMWKSGSLGWKARAQQYPLSKRNYSIREIYGNAADFTFLNFPLCSNIIFKPEQPKYAIYLEL